MELFVGTKDGFNMFFKGYCKNKVNYIATKERKRCKGICECCGEKKELQSAHTHDLDRKSIISDLLDDYLQTNGSYKVDLMKFESDFIAAHQPIREHFYFLCHECHKKYDDNLIDETAMKYLHN